MINYNEMHWRSVKSKYGTTIKSKQKGKTFKNVATKPQ